MFSPVDFACQPGNRRRRKNCTHRQIYFKTIAKTRQHRSGQQRIAAQFEKVLMNSDGSEFENVSPYSGDGLLGVVVRLNQSFR